MVTGRYIEIHMFPFSFKEYCEYYSEKVTKANFLMNILSRVLCQLSKFLMENISNLTSPNKVSDILSANEVPTNHVTIQIPAITK